MNFLVDPVMQGSAGGGQEACSGLGGCGWFIGQCDDLQSCWIFWETK
jgi:hypothetical protein